MQPNGALPLAPLSVFPLDSIVREQFDERVLAFRLP